MLYCTEQELADFLAAWPAAEDRVTQLYELDPTHVSANHAGHARSIERKSARESRSPLPFCLLSDDTPVPAMLELDPTHTYAH